MPGPYGLALPGLKGIRKSKILTQSELAQLAGMGRLTVIRAEAGDPISLQNVKKLAAALGVSVEQLQGTYEKQV